MDNRKLMLFVGAAALGLLTLATACGEDTPSGPMFGDISFTPSFENIGSGRSLEMTVTNASSSDLSSVLLGIDVIKRTTMPDSLCSTILADVTPSNVPSLASGEDETIDVALDTQNVDLQDCPPGQYDADVFAAISGTILGGATIRFDWSGTPP